MPQRQKVEEVSVPTFVKWSNAQAVDVRPANVFLLQRSPVNEVMLIVGHVAPPVLYGSPAEQQSQAKSLAKAGLETTVLGRYTMTVECTAQLLQALQEHLKVPSADATPKGVGSCRNGRRLGNSSRGSGRS